MRLAMPPDQRPEVPGRSALYHVAAALVDVPAAAGPATPAWWPRRRPSGPC